MAEQKAKPLYDKFHNINLDYLKETVNSGKVSIEKIEKLLDYWEIRIADSKDLLYHNYFEYYLLFESIHCVFLSTFVYEMNSKEMKHQYGIISSAVIEIIERVESRNIKDYLLNRKNGLSEEFGFQGDQLRTWLRAVEFGNTVYLIGAIYPSGLDINKNLHRFENVLKHFYLPEIFEPDLRTLPLFSELNKDIVKKIEKYLQYKKPITFTVFRFEGFHKYIKLAGEYFGREIISELVKQITSKLKQDDTCYVLSPREYLIVSVNCEKSILENRFYKETFQVKSLLLNYEVKFTTRRLPINDLSLIWNEIVP